MIERKAIVLIIISLFVGASILGSSIISQTGNESYLKTDEETMTSVEENSQQNDFYDNLGKNTDESFMDDPTTEEDNEEDVEEVITDTNEPSYPGNTGNGASSSGKNNGGSAPTGASTPHVITFVSHTYDNVNDISNWTYDVTSGSGSDVHAISHWSLSLGLCISESDIVDASETYEFGTDPNTGIRGIKFDDEYDEGENRIVWFQLSGDYNEGLVEYGIKAGQTITYGEIVGPICTNIKIVKTANPVLIYSGEEVTYTYEITNNGDSDLDNVIVTDDQGLTPAYISGDNGDNILQPGETWIYQATANPTEDVTNIGTVTADDEFDNEVTDSDDATVNVINPDIKIVKTANPVLIYSGEEVTYTYEITNNGDSDLDNVIVTDDQGLTPAYISGDNGDNILQPGETWIYQATANPTEDVTNIGTVTADDEFDNEVTDSDDATVNVINPDIKIVKTANPDLIYSGEEVTYTYEITNNGDSDLDNVIVTDDQSLTPVYTSGDNGDNILQPGETWTYQATANPTEDITNIGTVTADDEFDNEVTDSNDATVNVINPDIKIVKTANPDLIYSGEEVTYTYEITNNGDSDLDNVIVTDDQSLTPVYTSGDNGDNILQPGETWTYQATANPTEDITNIGTVTADDEFDNEVTDSNDATVNVINPDIKIVKTANPDLIYSGEEVTYTYEITNNGDSDLDNVIVTDDQSLTPVYTSGDNGDNILQPGETWTYQATANPTEDITNIGTVTADDEFDNEVTDSNDATVNVINPDIKIVKTANPDLIYSGEEVTYTYEITNNGDSDLDNVIVTDDQSLTPVYTSGDNGDNILQPGETWTYQATANPTEDITNIGTVTADDEFDNEVTDSNDATVNVINPDIKIVKTANPDEIYCGQEVTYTYNVTNIGDCDLHDIEVLDDKLGPITQIVEKFNGNDDDILNPGETWKYIAKTDSISIPEDEVILLVVDGENSYYNLTLSDVPDEYDVIDGYYLCWCVQRDVYMPRGIPHLVYLYSTYDPNMPTIGQNNEWDKVNYILNNKNGYDKDDIQAAIWYYINGIAPETGSPAWAIIADADANGDGFCPGPGQVIAILTIGGSDIQRTIFELHIPEDYILIQGDTTNTGTVTAIDELSGTVSDSDTATVVVN